MIAQPPIQPVVGPNARVARANVVPQSGSAWFMYLKANATNSIGTNEMRITAGEPTATPATAAMKPRTAASEYAGAVEPVPMTTFDMNDTAFVLRPPR
jgi:hypothetical protein